MPLSDDLIKKLKRKFEPSITTQFRYRSNDIVVQSDEEETLFVLTLEKQMKKALLKVIATAAY